METLLSIMIGLGLAAACGFRVFVPLLALAIAARTGHVHLMQSLAWIGTDASIVAFATATVLEIVAYKVPWLDHALDLIASPAAVVAGAIVAASQVGLVAPSGSGGHLLTWGAGIVAGGAAAGVVQSSTVGVRALSTATTGGLANPVVALGESAAAATTSLLTVIAPIAGVLLIIVIVGLLVATLLRVRRIVMGRRTAPRPLALAA